MTVTIINTPGYKTFATVSQVPALPGQYHLKFQSQLLGTRFPDERRTQFAATVTKSGLEELGREIYETLLKDAT